jgi:hypothetical protein
LEKGRGGEREGWKECGRVGRRKGGIDVWREGGKVRWMDRRIDGERV